jgi:hypothetical protein
MTPLVTIIRNLCAQGGATGEITQNLEVITSTLEEALAEFQN